MPDGPANPPGGVDEKAVRCPITTSLRDADTQQTYEATVEDAQAELEADAAISRDLVITEDELLEARETAASYSLEDVRRVCFTSRYINSKLTLQILTLIHNRHKHDLNFPSNLLLRIGDFLGTFHITCLLCFTSNTRRQ